MENQNSLKVIAALAAGALAGTVLTLLFAPAKGSDTRKRILKTAKDISENLKQKIGGENTGINGKTVTSEELANS
jgi:gas vesicle protein